jgi:hypothetical protein
MRRLVRRLVCAAVGHRIEYRGRPYVGLVFWWAMLTVEEQRELLSLRCARCGLTRSA